MHKPRSISFSDKNMLFRPSVPSSLQPPHFVSVFLQKHSSPPFSSVSKALHDDASTTLACFISQLPPLLKVLEPRFSDEVGRDPWGSFKHAGHSMGLSQWREDATGIWDPGAKVLSVPSVWDTQKHCSTLNARGAMEKLGQATLSTFSLPPKALLPQAFARTGYLSSLPSSLQPTFIHNLMPHPGLHTEGKTLAHTESTAPHSGPSMSAASVIVP